MKKWVMVVLGGFILRIELEADGLGIHYSIH